MKSEKHENPTEPEIKFPILMENKNKNIIVLFLSESSGVTVCAEDAQHRLGEYSSDFVSAQSDYWHPFQGSVTLSN